MAISAQTIADYAPLGNAVLDFEVGTGVVTTDPTTGNTKPTTEVVSYLAALRLETPAWTGKPGSDETIYACSGRLLSPSLLDPRITNGSQADATINGYRGRFEVTFNLAMNKAAYQDIRQSLTGTFRVIGGPL